MSCSSGRSSSKSLGPGHARAGLSLDWAMIGRVLMSRVGCPQQVWASVYSRQIEQCNMIGVLSCDGTSIQHVPTGYIVVAMARPQRWTAPPLLAVYVGWRLKVRGRGGVPCCRGQHIYVWVRRVSHVPCSWATSAARGTWMCGGRLVRGPAPRAGRFKAREPRVSGGERIGKLLGEG
jgi:hypothetical protein